MSWFHSRSCWFHSYDSIGELREKLTNHLTQKIRAIHQPTGLAQAEENAPALEDPLPAMAQQFDTAVLRCETEWVAERDSKPMSEYEAKHILKRLGEDALDFRVMLDGKVDHDVISILTDVAKGCKAIQNHKIYMDGGKSYKAFWAEGDSLIQSMKDAQSKLKAAIQQENHREAEAKAVQKHLLEVMEEHERERRRALSKADLVFSIVKRDVSSQHLRITNAGKAHATNIKVASEKAPVENNSYVKQKASGIPQELSPDDYFELFILIPPKATDISVSWSDDSGEPGFKRHVINPNKFSRY